MNDLDFKDKSTLRVIGREFLIVVVVIFSSLSFTLGFFVGRKAGERNAEPVAQIMESVPVQKKQGAPQIQTTKSDQGSSQAASPSQEDNLNTHQDTVSAAQPKAQDAPKGSVKENGKEVTMGTPDQKKLSPPEQEEVKGEGIYIVQLGALKNKHEADNFKKKYEKKGYKIYITISKGAKNGKIYKVRTGEFKERKDAEVLALRLKKTEGLNTFVTSKN